MQITNNPFETMSNSELEELLDKCKIDILTSTSDAEFMTADFLFYLISTELKKRI